MAIIEDVKCPRCDRKYSGVRSRCPFCGARRIGFGKYSKDTDNNARGKMMISVLILAVLTVAAAVMLFTTDPADAVEIQATATPDPEDAINSIGGIDFNTPTPFVTNTPTPIPEASIVEILYDGRSLAAKDSFTRNVNPSHSNGGPLSGFTIRVEPLGFDFEVDLYSDNEDIFTVERTTESAPYNFIVHPVSPGNAKLIATCGDRTHTVYVTITG